MLGNVTELLKQLDVKSTALNGTPFGESLGGLIASISGKSPADDSESVVVIDEFETNVESDYPQVEETSDDSDSVENDAADSDGNPNRIVSVEFENDNSLQ